MLASNRQEDVAQVLIDTVSYVLTSTSSVNCTAALFDAHVEECDFKPQIAMVLYFQFSVEQWQITVAVHPCWGMGEFEI